MKLYLIMNEGDEMYVLATSYGHAISKWKDRTEIDEEPGSVNLIANEGNIIL